MNASFCGMIIMFETQWDKPCVTYAQRKIMGIFAMQTHTAFTIDQKDALLYFPVFPPLPLSLSHSLSVVLQKSVSSDWQLLQHRHTVTHRKKNQAPGQTGERYIDLSAATFKLIYYPADSLLTPTLMTVYYKSLSWYHSPLFVCVSV